jgi:hypothetical protein
VRTWKYVEPTAADDPTPIEVFVTEEEILRDFFPFWSAQMIRVGKQELISPENCIDDWVVVHWAELVQ